MFCVCSLNYKVVQNAYNIYETQTRDLEVLKLALCISKPNPHIHVLDQNMNLFSISMGLHLVWMTVDEKYVEQFGTCLHEKAGNV